MPLLYENKGRYLVLAGSQLRKHRKTTGGTNTIYRSFVDPVKSIPQTRELSGEYGVMSPTEFHKKIRKPVISEETEEEAQLPPTTSMPTRPPFWLRRKLKTQLLESLERDPEFADDSNDDLVTLRRLFPKRSTTPGPPTTRHIHTWKNRRVIEIGSSERVEIVKRRKHKRGKVPSSHTTLGPQISTVPSNV
ncbi:unnamed protein product [Allacma fusca]|uniref:Uncharacterized protein n=1 Tax=Allacma fusca TaxID=39272 RepID=A0A8J2LI58_9HEXA|nr:unnamed protein product [Allacma fusca]